MSATRPIGWGQVTASRYGGEVLPIAGQDESQRTIARQAQRIETLEQALRDIRDGVDAPCAIVARVLG